MPAAASRTPPQYEIRRQLGRGGMGIVYQAFDRKHGRHVALKTLLNESDGDTLALFRRELAVLSQISHPNIVDVYDSGEMEEGGRLKPFFVMPLLRGQTLQEMFEKSRQPMAVNRLTDIMVQTLKGLQAAHESGLIHRDLKPSNIFILEDYSVNIIDFGVAHLVNLKTTMGLKGTIYYMAPEQLTRKPLQPSSDLFSLGVVCFEALTGRHPFEGRGEREIVEAILHYTPPLVSEINPAVNQQVSLVIQKALAKDPVHRFPSATDMAECLQKAVRNEPIEYFNPDRIQPRVARARKAAADGDHEYALEILVGLEAEGFTLPEITGLRQSIEEESKRKVIQSLLETAKRRFQEEEFQLALKKLHELDDIDPDNAEGHALRAQIEDRRSWAQIDEWLKIGRQHLENRSFDHARSAVESALRVRPKDTRVLRLREEIDQREKEHRRINQEKAKLFEAAVAARQRGDLESALGKLERVLELDRLEPDITSPSSVDAHQKLFNEVRAEHQSFAHALDRVRKHSANDEFSEALATCDEYLQRYPGHVILHALRLEVLERRKQQQSGFIAKVRQTVDKESDLDRRVALLKEAIERYPADPSLVSSLEIVERKRELVNGIIGVARSQEESGQFSEALTQWESVRILHPEYPGIDDEMERLKQRRDEQARIEARAGRIEEIERALKLSDFPRSLDLCRKALAEFREDSELLSLERQAAGAIARREEALRLLEEGRKLSLDGNNNAALASLRQAHGLDEHEPAIRLLLVEVLLKAATALRDGDLLAVEPLVDEALRIDSSNVRARSLRTLLLDRKYNQFVNELLAKSREKEAEGDRKAALAEIDKILARYPQEGRALRRKAQLEDSTASDALDRVRLADLEELKGIEQQAESTGELSVLESLNERSVAIAAKHPQDPAIQATAASILKCTEKARIPQPQTEQGQGDHGHAPQGTSGSQLRPQKKQAPAARSSGQRRHRKDSGQRFPWILIPVATAALSLVIIVASRIASLDAAAGSSVASRSEKSLSAAPPSGQNTVKPVKSKRTRRQPAEQQPAVTTPDNMSPDLSALFADESNDSQPEEYATVAAEAPAGSSETPPQPNISLQEIPGALATPHEELLQAGVKAPKAELSVSTASVRLTDQDPTGVIVHWSVMGADQVMIEPQDKFDQTLQGQCRLYPAHSMTIRVTAWGPGGSLAKELKVEVDDTSHQLPPAYASRRCEPLRRPGAE